LPVGSRCGSGTVSSLARAGTAEARLDLHDGDTLREGIPSQTDWQGRDTVCGERHFDVPQIPRNRSLYTDKHRGCISNSRDHNDTYHLGPSLQPSTSWVSTTGAILGGEELSPVNAADCQSIPKRCRGGPGATEPELVEIHLPPPRP
jgi:hypothetical protein